MSQSPPLSPNASADVQCVIYSGPDTSRAGREICFASVEDALTIVDVTDKANPVRLSRLTYSNSDRTYTHQVNHSFSLAYL